MAYSKKGNGKFQDQGFLGPNSSDNPKAPSHTGILTLSPQTLKELNRRYQDGEDIELELSAWRKDDDPRKFSVKTKPKYKKEGGDSRRDDRDEPRERSRGSVRRDDRDEHDREFDRDDRKERRSRDDDFPGDRRRGYDDDRRERRYAGEDEL